MSNHTQGTWMYCQLSNNEYDIVTPEGDTVAYLNVLNNSTTAPELEANARLMASAPDLLDALDRALPFVEDALHDGIYTTMYVQKVSDEILNALHKATGG